MLEYNDNLDKELAITDDTPPAPVKSTSKIPPLTIKEKAVKTLWFLVIFAVSLVLAGGTWLAKEWFDRDIKGYHYKRTCELPVDVNMDITGTRRYLNQVNSFMGMKFVDTANASEETRIDASHTATTVIGITGDQWWSIHNPAAEPRVLLLKPADTYIFTQAEKTYVIRYEEFCK